MQKRTGISLIVLVITIIVMIILAGAIILTLNNSGIIDKATDAVEQSNLTTVKELTQMAWAEAYATGERTEEGLKEAVDKALSDNKVDTTKYVIEVTTKGVTVALKGPWTQQGLTVTNGTVTLEIGDKIVYDETNKGTITGLTETEWRVLGTNDNGDLLIMSTNNIAEAKLSTSVIADPLIKAQQDWLNGPTILDGLCVPYGKGKGATGSRSVRVEDVNKVTGYNPEMSGFGKGSVYEYGSEVKISYNGTTAPVYSGTNGVSGTLNDHSDGFNYYNGVEFVTIKDLTTGISGTEFHKIRNTKYSYNVLELDLLKRDSKTFKMIFEETGEYDNDTYWLASQYAEVFINAIWYGIYSIEQPRDKIGVVSTSSFWTSDGAKYERTYGVRAVVTLAPDIQLTGSSETGWTY